MTYRLTYFLMLCLVLACGRLWAGEHTMDFQGREAALEAAILNDDTAAVARAIDAGANPNARGQHQVTPVEYAVGHLKKQATAELLRRGANPNLKDAEGNNAVTLAVSAYRKVPELLEMVLRAGGDPNTRLPDNDPILVSFIIERNLDGIRLLKMAGANLNIRDRSDRPLVVKSGILQFWDVVWCLLGLGATYDYSGEPKNLAKSLANSDVTPPDSPLWPYKVKVWHFLHDRGMVLPPLR